MSDAGRSCDARRNRARNGTMSRGRKPRCEGVKKAIEQLKKVEESAEQADMPDIAQHADKAIHEMEELQKDLEDG